METFSKFKNAWNNCSGRRYVFFRDGFIIADNYVHLIVLDAVVIVLILYGNIVAVIDLNDIKEVR